MLITFNEFESFQVQTEMNFVDFGFQLRDCNVMHIITVKHSIDMQLNCVNNEKVGRTNCPNEIITTISIRIYDESKCTLIANPSIKSLAHKNDSISDTKRVQFITKFSFGRTYSFIRFMRSGASFSLELFSASFDSFC